MDRTMPCTVDTLSIFQWLKKARMEEDAAREIAEVLKDVVETNQVTLNGLERTKSELKLAIEQSKADLAKWMAGLLIAQAAVVVALIKLL